MAKGRRSGADLRRATLLAGLALIGSACEARTYTGTLYSGGFGGAPMLPAVPDDPAFVIPDALVGTWTGYVEGSRLPPGSDVVTLTLDHPPDGGDQIRVVFGTASPPALPTAATDAWTPGGPLMVEGDAGPFDGFVYVAHEVRWQARRLTFSIASWDPWQTWCQLQTSYPYSGEIRSRCVPSDADCYLCFAVTPPPGTLCGPSSSTGVAPSCEQALRCVGDHPCLCDAVRCESNSARNRWFDLAFDSDVAASGTASLLVGLVTLRLMR